MKLTLKVRPNRTQADVQKGGDDDGDDDDDDDELMDYMCMTGATAWL